MSYTRTAQFDAQRSLAFGSIVAGYTLVGSNTFFYPVRVLIVQNLTDATVQFSTNGSVDHFPLAAGDKFVLDIAANDAEDNPWFLPKEQGVYVKRIGTPTTGSVYVSAVFGRTD